MKSWPFIGSDLKLYLGKQSMLDLIREQYSAFPDERYFGIHQSFSFWPALVIKDLDVIKDVGIKSFQHFPDHLTVFDQDSEIITMKSLIFLKGEQWKDMRATLSPAFTSSKMRGMFEMMSECARDLAGYFLEESQGKVLELNIKDVARRYTNDVIASTVFGVKCDSLREKENEFFKMGEKFSTINALDIIKSLILIWVPKLTKITDLGVNSNPTIQFFKSIVLNNIKKRTEENIIRPDMIHLLMEARKGNLKHENDVDLGFATAEESEINKARKLKMDLSDDVVVAQAFIFFVAGFDTSSTVMSFMSMELAANEDVQKKLLEEVDQVFEKHGQNPSYETILGMKYLDQVLSEALRKWTPAAQTDRICAKDFIIEPSKDGEKPLHIPKGTMVAIPIAGIHYDPKYFPEPDKFDPERFSDENKANIVPGSYMPFGIGPRNCIGSRFALLEIKVLFYHLLCKFELVVVEKTHLPIEMDPKSFLPTPKGGYWVGFKPRKEKAS
ncbi:cytochrome p450 [Rhyzopertha dominica]|nr:cytochrome p450 [Rhyzopertha dominica]